MPRLKRIDEFEIGIKARLQCARSTITLSRMERIIVMGCYQMTPLDDVPPSKEATDLILKLRELSTRGWL